LNNPGKYATISGREKNINYLRKQYFSHIHVSRFHSVSQHSEMTDIHLVIRRREEGKRKRGESGRWEDRKAGKREGREEGG
jgi:hypothetical protein